MVLRPYACAQIIVAVAINKERPPLPHDTPPRLASLILRCWSENPAGRPRVNQLLAELSDMMRVSARDVSAQAHCHVILRGMHISLCSWDRPKQLAHKAQRLCQPTTDPPYTQCL
jgi:hypothetical protein